MPSFAPSSFLSRTKLKWDESEKRDRNFRRSRFRPFPGGFMSLAVANDFAFPNEDIRWGSIRRMTFDLAKTGFRRIRKEIRTEPCRGEKILTVVFVLWCWPKFHLELSASLTQQRQTFVDFDFVDRSSSSPPLTALTALVFACWFSYR